MFALLRFCLVFVQFLSVSLFLSFEWRCLHCAIVPYNYLTRFLFFQRFTERLLLDSQKRVGVGLLKIADIVETLGNGLLCFDCMQDSCIMLGKITVLFFFGD